MAESSKDTNNGKLNYCLDEVPTKGWYSRVDQLTVRGWVLSSKGQVSSSARLHINDTKLDISKEPRPDVKEHFSPHREVEAWSGFVKTFTLLPGRYRLLLEVHFSGSEERHVLWKHTIRIHSFSRLWRKLKRSWKKKLGASSPVDLLAVLRTPLGEDTFLRNLKSSGPAVPKVNVVGYFGHDFGLSQTARSSVVCLEAAGVPTEKVALSKAGYYSIPYPDELERCRKDFPHSINLLQVNPPEWGHLERAFPDIRLPYYYNIGFWYWELPEIPGIYRRELNKLDELWVGSKFNFDAFHKVSPVPVHIMPPSLPLRPWPSEKVPGIELPSNRLLVLFAYDFNSSSNRKNPEACVEAFLEARKSCPELHLVLKTHSVNKDSAEWQRLVDKLDCCSEVTLLSKHLPRSQQVWLQQRCDIFLSLHRAEGFGLNLAECMALGKPVVATNYSGNTDFMNPENSCLVDYDIVPVPTGHYCNNVQGTWAEPRIEHAVEHLVNLVRDPVRARAIGELAKQSISKYCSPQRIGKLMRQRLEHISENRAA